MQTVLYSVVVRLLSLIQMRDSSDSDDSNAIGSGNGLNSPHASAENADPVELNQNTTVFI